MIIRNIENQIKEKFFLGKAILLFGPRQVGKTTLIKKIVSEIGIPFQWFSGDEPDIRLALSNTTSTQLKALIGTAKLVVIDEAQRVENIGITLKLIIDNFPEIQVVATGSSAFELANRINEPLTGRKFVFSLFPFSFQELSQNQGLVIEKRMLENRLIYGSYPEVINNIGNEKEGLNLLIDSYLYKDLLVYDGLKKSSLLHKLLLALALQVGSEVSYTNLGQVLGVDKNTVEKYIDLLEQVFVVFRLNAFSRNIRNELKKTKKVFFYDNGVRNAIIGNFQTLATRNDVGALWENYLISERKKYFSYEKLYGGQYFWRTTQQQEINYLEERDGKIDAFEFKWIEKKTPRLTKTFSEAYPETTFKVINPANYQEFLSN